MRIERASPAQLDELEPLWAAMHAHHSAYELPTGLAGLSRLPIGIRQANAEARAFYTRRGAEPLFETPALPA